MAELLVDMFVEFVEILEVFVLISDSTSVILPAARVPSTVTSELKVVASSYCSACKSSYFHSRATPSHSSVPALFVRAVPSMYKLFATEKSLSALTVPEI